MANPQKENGYTPIANELLEAICKAKLNATQKSIILAVCRFTYGFSRVSCIMSISFVAQAVNLSIRQVSKEMLKLIDQKVIFVVQESTKTKAREIMLNKNYDDWGYGIGVPHMNNSSIEQQFTTGMEQEFQSPMELQFHQDKQIIKQNIKQDICAFFPELWERYPNKRGKAKVTARAKKEMDRLGYDKMAACIKRYVEDKPDWQQYQNGSTFFNGGYLDYLDNSVADNVSATGAEDSDELKAIKARLRR